MIEKLQELGLFVMPDFVSIDEQNILLEHIKKGAPKKTKARNTIQRFGSSLPYPGNMVSKTIPSHFNFLIDRLLEHKLLTVAPDSITVNEYFAGQAIAAHIDSKESGSVITILSLLSDAKMVFQKQEEKYIFEYSARCLVQLKQELRTNWTHAIMPVPSTRYSIVFRQSATGS